jgi:hypothetical protein
MARREQRQLTRAEGGRITSRRLVVRKVGPQGCGHRPSPAPALRPTDRGEDGS